jgi:hypothetical protein
MEVSEAEIKNDARDRERIREFRVCMERSTNHSFISIRSSMDAPR